MPRCLSYTRSSLPCAALSFPPWPRFPPCRRLPLLRGPASPPAPRPPVRPTFLSPRCRGLLAAFTRGAARRYADPRSASRRSGIAAPASATAQPLARLGAACAGGWPSSPRRHAFGVHGWAPGGTRSRGARSPRGPVPCGQSGPREDRRGVLRGSLPRSSALRASGGGARVLVHTGIAVCKAHGCSILLPRQEAVLFHTSKAGEYKILKQLFLHLGR